LGKPERFLAQYERKYNEHDSESLKSTAIRMLTEVALTGGVVCVAGVTGSAVAAGLAFCAVGLPLAVGIFKWTHKMDVESEKLESIAAKLAKKRGLKDTNDTESSPQRLMKQA
jgi:hypothetical protein